jgi:hypothetical protein
LGHQLSRSPRLPRPQRAEYPPTNLGFNFNDIAQTVELLSQTNLGEKNMIFGYSNKTMKEWATLKKYMESNLLNLLSVAKFIEQSLRFDL